MLYVQKYEFLEKSFVADRFTATRLNVVYVIFSTQSELTGGKNGRTKKFIEGKK